MESTDEKGIKLRDLTIKDWWLYSQVRIEQDNCPECQRGQSIKINKGQDLTRLIKILQKLNYKGINKEDLNE